MLGTVLPLLNAQEQGVRAPLLGAVLLHAGLTVSEGNTKHKGQILPFVSPEQRSETVKVLSLKWHRHYRVIK